MARKFENADPLRRGVRRPNAAALRAAAQRAAQSKAQSPVALPRPPVPQAKRLGAGQQSEASDPSDMKEFALKMCTEEELSEARYHILKFKSREPVDPAANFEPPIRLHRKDPKQLQILATEQAEEDDSDMEVDSKEDVGGELGTGASLGDQASGEPEKVKKRPFGRKRKTYQVHGGEKNDAARKLRYEEHYPWVMEDFDSKNTWISSYEAAQANTYAILTYDATNNGFKIIPIEKHYKMSAAARHATLSLEDAEEKMESKNSMRDRWMMSHLQPRGLDASSTDAAVASGYGNAQPNRLRTVVGSEERKHKYNLDEEMDYDEQEMFDDDEGAPILDGPEEELKEAEARIKQEQMKANELMDASNDADIDNLFEDEGLREGRQGRKLRKALRSLEKNQYYDSDEEENPYVSEEESEDSSDDIASGFSKIKQEEDANGAGLTDNMAPLVSQLRKKVIDKDSLPRGTVVLQLTPQLLAKFAAGEWNPGAKRSQSEPPSEEDPLLLTRDDVRRNISSGETDIKQLLTSLKSKLAQHPDNVTRLRQYVKEVARRKDGKLFLR